MNTTYTPNWARIDLLTKQYNEVMRGRGSRTKVSIRAGQNVFKAVEDMIGYSGWRYTNSVAGITTNFRSAIMTLDTTLDSDDCIITTEGVS